MNLFWTWGVEVTVSRQSRNKWEEEGDKSGTTKGEGKGKGAPFPAPLWELLEGAFLV